VYYQTGVPFSKGQCRGKPPEDMIFKTIKLTADRNALYDRIDKRVLSMIDAGLVDEVRELLDKQYVIDSPGLQCVGYHELILYLNGDIDLETAIGFIQRNSRRYAKRQYTWFGNQIPGVEFESGVTVENLQMYYKNFT
jgi:tRNA dimethylallyltransferase